ncbi:ABC transporter ATP-binding protein [Actinomyces howellii]|uniref:Daunorubicin/doxorubicin resistance ATP-binding protein DrrA n=1 Tax=Actinomyces howellii TaxID=52771 RepID=A0A448HJT7_9ACTO|nr:ABC transporter ATP-binding protein [Actinomyces howellii]VEG29966.1 Daunorubicin/doxorubicin resistance ATP-binding protein DrrA [Actinomyces howellii]
MRESLSELVVCAEGLVKSFGRTRALDGLDLGVRVGEVHGFLGPNGAGKSTTIRALLGQIRLDSGTVEVLGMPAWSRAVDIHARLAYVPGDTQLWPGLSGGECIDLLGGLQGSVSPSRRDELIERFELDPGRRLRTYSKGNRQKVALIAALSTEAELLVLDEPTSGLDPLMEVVFQEVVAERAAQGVTVLLSSHILAEVEALCDSVTVIRAGRTVSSGPLEELRRQAPTAVEAITSSEPRGLAAIAGVTGLERDRDARGPRTRLLVAGRGLAAVIGALSAAGITHLSVRPPSVEQLFMAHYAQRADAASPDGVS